MKAAERVGMSRRGARSGIQARQSHFGKSAKIFPAPGKLKALEGGIIGQGDGEETAQTDGQQNHS